MRNPWARRMVTGLILAFPLLVSVAASPSPSGLPTSKAGSWIAAVAPVAAVEMVLVGGLVFASRERRRLQIELEASRTTPVPLITLSQAILSRPRVAARASVISYLKR